MSATTVVGRAEDGARFAVIVPHADAETELLRRWPPRGLERIEDEGEAAERSATVPATADVAAWDRIESDLGLFAAEHLADLVAIHAALAVVDGRALMLPGRSFAGKTTLALALSRAGAIVASDEYTLVDAGTGLVRGWSRPARVRLAGGGSRREPVAADVPPTPVGLLALLRYAQDASDPLDASVPSRADVVVAVLDETVCARSRPDAALDAALAVTGAAVLSGRRGDADTAAAALLEELAGGGA